MCWDSCGSINEHPKHIKSIALIQFYVNIVKISNNLSMKNCMTTFYQYTLILQANSKMILAHSKTNQDLCIESDFLIG